MPSSLTRSVLEGILSSLDDWNQWLQDPGRYPDPAPRPDIVIALLGDTIENQYLVLGLDSTASATEVRHRKRELALRLHPDKLPNGIDLTFRKQCELKYIVYQRAWKSILSGGCPAGSTSGFEPLRLLRAQTLLWTSVNECSPLKTLNPPMPTATDRNIWRYGSSVLVCVLLWQAVRLTQRRLGRKAAKDTQKAMTHDRLEVNKRVTQTAESQDASTIPTPSFFRGYFFPYLREILLQVVSISGQIGLHLIASCACQTAWAWAVLGINPSTTSYVGLSIDSLGCKLGYAVMGWFFSAPMVTLVPLPTPLLVVGELAKGFLLLLHPYEQCTFKCLEPETSVWDGGCCIVWVCERVAVMLVYGVLLGSFGFLLQSSTWARKLLVVRILLWLWLAVVLTFNGMAMCSAFETRFSRFVYLHHLR